MAGRYDKKDLSELPSNRAHRREIATQEKLAAVIEKRKHLAHMKTFWLTKLQEIEARYEETVQNHDEAVKQERELREHLHKAVADDREERKKELTEELKRLRAEMEELEASDL